MLTLPLFSLEATLSTGCDCSSESFVDNAVEEEAEPVIEPKSSVDSNLSNRYTVERDGDSSIGTIYYYRQIHAGGKVRAIDQLRQLDGFLPQTYEQILYHMDMYNEIHRLRKEEGVEINVVFSESISQRVLDRIFDPSKKNDYDTAHELLPDGEISKENTKMLGAAFLHYLGAGIVYALRHDIPIKVDVLTDDEAEQDEIYRIKAKSEFMKQEFSCEIVRYAHDYRESRMMSAVEHYLKENPGDVVLVVYGYNHDLHDNLSAGFNPRMLSTDFFTDERRADQDYKSEIVQEAMDGCKEY